MRIRSLRPPLVVAELLEGKILPSGGKADLVQQGWREGVDIGEQGLVILNRIDAAIPNLRGPRGTLVIGHLLVV